MLKNTRNDTNYTKQNDKTSLGTQRAVDSSENTVSLATQSDYIISDINKIKTWKLHRSNLKQQAAAAAATRQAA